MLRYRAEFGYYAERGMEASQEEKNALNDLVTLQIQEALHTLREIHLQLKTKLKAFNEIWDSFPDFVAGEGLYEGIVHLLNDAQEHFNTHLPLIERKLLHLSLRRIKSEVDQEGRAVSYLLGVFRSENDNEAKRLLDGSSRLYKNLDNISEKQRNSIVVMTEKYMYQRFMMEEIVKFRQNELEGLSEEKEEHQKCYEKGCLKEVKENANDGRKENSKPLCPQESPGHWRSLLYRLYRSCFLNGRIVLIIIALPFMLTILGELLPEAYSWRLWPGQIGFGIYFLLAQLLMLGLVIGLFISAVQAGIRFMWNKRRNRDENIEAGTDSKRETRRLGIFELFIPKLFGMLFIAFPSMFLSDEAWSIACGAVPGLEFIISILFLLATYLFINHVMMKDIDERDIRDKRSKQVLSLGMLESFLMTMFFTIKMGRVMGSEIRGGIENVMGKLNIGDGGLIPIMMKISLWDGLGNVDWLKYILSLNMEIYPRFILFWTVQTLFIGVVLQMFLTKDKMVEID